MCALTKSTAVVILFPLCLVAAGGLLYQHRIGAIWRGVLIAVVAAVLIAGHTSRNIESFGHPFGPLEHSEGGYSLGMERHDLEAVGSNLMRNLALHAMLTSNAQVARVEQRVRALHSMAGWNPDDPQTTWHPTYSLQVALACEGKAPAPLHVIYFFCSAPFLIWLVVRRKGWGLGLALWICVALGFVLFVSLVKWNLWHTRLHAPLLAVGAIPIAVAFTSSRRAWLRYAIVAITVLPVVALLLWVAWVNLDRRLLGPAGVLVHPRNDTVRWRTADALASGMGMLDVLQTLEPGPYALLGGDHEYNIMRSVRSLSDEWQVTAAKPQLGRTQSTDPRWVSPEILITVYHARPVIVHDDRLFEMLSPPGSINVYRVTAVLPKRGPTDSVATIGRYAAFSDQSAAGRMRGDDPRIGMAFGRVLPGSGIDIDVPGDQTPRVLLLGLHGMGLAESTVRISINDEALHAGPIDAWGYSMLRIEVPPMLQAATLQIRLPRAEKLGLAHGAAVGWIQLPTARWLIDYDAQ